MRTSNSIKCLVLVIIVFNAAIISAQLQYQERLPQNIFDVAAPST